MTNFQDKVVLITGASRGIGRAILEGFAKSGAIVVGTATSENGAKAISEHLKAIGGKGFGVACNVNEQGQVDTLFDSIKANAGTISVLVNNAGVTQDNLFMRMKQDEWDKVIATDLTGVFRLTKGVIKQMMKARYGRVVTIGSVVGVAGNPGQANYCAAKAGVIGFTKSLAQELASRNITANVVAPGFIETDMTGALTEEQARGILSTIPMSRMGQASEIADAVLFLASDKASYISGQTLHVNGGLYMN